MNGLRQAVQRPDTSTRAAARSAVHPPISDRRLDAAVIITAASRAAALDPGRALLSTPGGPMSLPCDAVLAFIGSIPPDSLLRAAGLQAAETAAPAGSFKAVEPALCPDGPEEART